MSGGLRRVYRERVCTPDQASEMVGTTVGAPDAAPDLAPGTVVHDADTREPVLAYLPLEEAATLRRAALRIDCGSGVQRQSNYRSRSRTFGYAPRRPVTRREGCALTALALETPDVQRTLEHYADQLSARLDDIDPNIVSRDVETLIGVLPEWRIGSAKVWTSGVINDTAALPYHRDGFNFPTWSAMPVVRRGVRGGHLHLPEYDLMVPCADSTVTYFPGYRYVHGVTPLRKVSPSGYRISIVYYALRGMKDCRTAAEETRYARQRRTQRETDMATRLAVGDRSIPNKGRGALDRMHGWGNM